MTKEKYAADEAANPQRISARVEWQTRLRIDEIKHALKRSETSIVMECLERGLPELERIAKLIRAESGDNSDMGHAAREKALLDVAETERIAIAAHLMNGY